MVAVKIDSACKSQDSSSLQSESADNEGYTLSGACMVSLQLVCTFFNNY
jgi:hypothetical protein